jgi:AcrR family transcriptional regulator
MSPVTQPQQKRSQRTQAKLLDASEAALQENDFDKISIQEIATRAGVSVGAFYARFSDKEALRECLIDRYLENIVSSSAEFSSESSSRGLDLAGKAEAFITLVVQGCRDRRGLMRMRYLHKITNDSSGFPQRPRERQMIKNIERFFEPCLAEIDHPDPAFALTFALRLVDTMAAHAVLLDQEIGSSYGSIVDRELIDELVRAFLGYLGVGRRRNEESG